MGTAMGRSLGREMGAVGNQGNIAMLGAGLGANEAEQQRRFQGAQGLAGMPGYYGAPASFEMQMLGLQQPYDIARFQGQTQTGIAQADMQSQFMNNLMSRDYQGAYMEPSGFERYISPWLNPLLGVGGDVAKYAIGAGGK